jgi:hypothetical protein
LELARSITARNFSGLMMIGLGLFRRHGWQMAWPGGKDVRPRQSKRPQEAHGMSGFLGILTSSLGMRKPRT